MVVNRLSSRSSDGVDRCPPRTASVPPSRISCAATAASCAGLRSLLLRASFSSRGTALSSVCMSARISSVSMTSMSDFGIDLAVDVRHVVVGEHPHHLADRVALADVGQELVAQTRALRRALDDAGDVDERHRRMHDLFRVKHLGELVQPRIRQRHHTLVRLDRRERVVGRQHVIARQRIEQR